MNIFLDNIRQIKIQRPLELFKNKTAIEIEEVEEEDINDHIQIINLVEIIIILIIIIPEIHNIIQNNHTDKLNMLRKKVKRKETNDSSLLYL